MNTQLLGFASFWHQSDMVTKSVACILLLMSICSWFVILARGIKLLYLRNHGNKAKGFWYAKTFAEGLKMLEINKTNNPFYNLAIVGQNAVAHHTGQVNDLQGALPLTEWLTTCLSNCIDDTAEKLQSGLSVMASVGSTSPFIGLFGTVWGIYHALVGISAAGRVNITEVAGPVGESLIMTALGLAVAIPAVLGYNAINRGNKNLLNKLNRFAHELHSYYIVGATPMINTAANTATNNAANNAANNVTNNATAAAKPQAMTNKVA